jgi:CheY-like chemotaxis protein
MKDQRTILLVDDSENDLVLMRRAFTKAKCNSPLQEVSNGEQAIAYLKGEGPYRDRNKFPLPAVMLLDLNMPKGSGFDVLAWVRAQPMLKRLAIIILTASNRSEDVNRAFDLGATSFLVKPIDMEELATMLRCLCDWAQFNHFPALHEVGATDQTTTDDHGEYQGR